MVDPTNPFTLTNSVAFAGVKLPEKVIAVGYTKLKNFKACPKRHFHYDIAKDVKQEEQESLTYGNEVHKSLQMRISKNIPLPPLLQQYEPWVEKFTKGANEPGTKILTEQQFAIDTELKPISWFDKKVFWRSIADAIKMVGPIAVNWDWKTGKPKEEPMQLVTAAACIMAWFPDIQIIRNEFVWLEHGFATRVDVRRDQLPTIWASVMPEIKMYQEAVRTMTFPPKKNGLCKNYCDVVSCPHQGK